VLLAKSGGGRVKARRTTRGAGGNLFPMRTAFFAAMQEALARGLDHALEVVAPFSSMEKEDVIRRGVELDVPLELTLSCMNPVAPRDPGGAPLHCGQCSKCRERRDAFSALGLDDPAPYASPPPR
jgi:7-cyano-7-deazaguanine synthase